MNELITMDTETLEKKLDEALQELIPLFKVGKKELSRFKKAAILRNILMKLESEVAYFPVENCFYFPGSTKLDASVEWQPFHPRVIWHETSHYIHSQINPRFWDRVYHAYRRKADMKNNRFRLYRPLTELVGEYANCTAIVDYPPFTLGKRIKEVYTELGIEFLPKLARASYRELTQIEAVTRFLTEIRVRLCEEL